MWPEELCGASLGRLTDLNGLAYSGSRAFPQMGASMMTCLASGSSIRARSDAVRPKPRLHGIYYRPLAHLKSGPLFCMWFIMIVLL